MASVESANRHQDASSSPSGWMIRMHIRAYRALNDKILDCGLYALNKLARPEETFQSYSDFGAFATRFAPVDYTIVTLKRAVNRVCRFAHLSRAFAPRELKTNNQREKKREKQLMRLEMGEKSPFAQFAKDTANFAYTLFPKVVYQQMLGIPSLAEKSFFYQLSLHYRYFNYQLDRRTDYRNNIVESSMSKTAFRWYCFTVANLIQPLLSKGNVSPILDLEYLLLKICQKLQPKEERPGKKMSDVVIASFARSIERLQQCAIDLKPLPVDSKNEAFIEWLGWYKRHGVLPPGVPDPEKVGLDNGNLEIELEKALYEYLDTISTAILDEIVPKKFKNPFVHFIYWIEGKNGLMKLLSYLIGELGVKQVSDPHLFALALLSALGIEIADFEIEAFGRKQMETIFKAGEKIIKRSQEKENYSSSLAVKGFLETGLKYCPRSVEGNEQKREARARLEKALCDLLYDAIKPERYRYEGVTKEVRKMVQKVPVLGSAAVLLNTFYTSISFSISYYLTEKKGGDETLLVQLIRTIWGKAYTQTLIERTMELLYHPAWRLVALQLISDVTNHLFNKAGEVHQLKKEPSTNDNVRTIVAFILRHYTPLESLPLLSNLNLTDAMVDSLKATFTQPGGKSFIEIVLESLLPVINETHAYLRLGESFRSEGVYFEGDAKFWELFIREYLNRAMLSAEKAGVPREWLPSARDKIVKKLLSMEKDEMRRELLTRPHFDPVVKQEEQIKDEDFIWDYEKEKDKEEEPPSIGRFGSEGEFDMVPESRSMDIKDDEQQRKSSSSTPVGREGGSGSSLLFTLRENYI